MMDFLSRSPARTVAGTLLLTVLLGALPLMVLVRIEASHKERFTQKIDRIVSDLRGMDLTLFHQAAIDSQLIDASEGKIGRAVISEGLADALSRRGLEISHIRVEGSGDFPHVVFDIGNVAEESSVYLYVMLRLDTTGVSVAKAGEYFPGEDEFRELGPACLYQPVSWTGVLP